MLSHGGWSREVAPDWDVSVARLDVTLLAGGLVTFDWDLDNRRARIEVPGLVRAHSEPIRNPVTDAEHQMITVLPDGWVFHEAENVAGFAKATGPIKFDLTRRHSSMANVAWNPNGLVHTYDEYKQKYDRP